MRNPSTPFAALMLAALVPSAIAAVDPATLVCTADNPTGAQSFYAASELPLGCTENCAQPPKNLADPASEGWTPLKEADGKMSYAKTENGSYQYWPGVPSIVVKYDAKTCATECPPAMKQYADAQKAAQQAVEDKGFTGNKTMFASDTGKDKSKTAPTPPDTSSETSETPPEESSEASAFSLGSQLGSDKDLFAGAQGKVSQAEAPSIDTPFAYEHAVQASNQVHATTQRIGDAASASRAFDGARDGRRDIDDARQGLKVEANTR